MEDSLDAIDGGLKKGKIPAECKVIQSSLSGAAQEVRSLPWRTGECGREKLSSHPHLLPSSVALCAQVTRVDEALLAPASTPFARPWADDKTLGRNPSQC